MTIQTSILFVIALCVASCASSIRTTTDSSPKPNTEQIDLSDFGSEITTMDVEGSLSTTGKQNVSGAAFSVLMKENNHFLLTIGGPLGITLAKMVASETDFTMVNYLQQEVWEGDPRSAELRAAMGLPIESTDLVRLLRGQVPGKPELFEFVESRDDGTQLYRRKADWYVEFLVVSPSTNTIVRYQRKSVESEVILDVSFSNMKKIGTAYVAHKVVAAADNGASTATVELDEVVLNQKITKPFDVKAPSSFTKKTYR